MRRRTFLASCAAAAIASRYPVLAAEADSCYARYDEPTRTWTMGNASLEVRFRLESTGQFHFAALVNKPAARTWTPPDNEFSSPIALTFDQVQLSENTAYELLEQSVEQIAPAGVRQRILLRAQQAPAEIRFEAEVYSGHPFLRYRTYYKNSGGAATKVTAADMLSWKFQGRGQRFFNLYVGQWAWGGERANFEPHEADLSEVEGQVEAFTGAYGNHSTWAALVDEAGQGLVFGWEFDGRARAHAEYIRSTRVVRTDSLIQQLNHPVAPGEEFLVPAAFVGAFEGDWDEAGYRTQRFVEAVLSAPLPGNEVARFPYLAFDSWGYQYDVNEKLLLEGAELAAELGVELFTIDFGWARVTGDWYPDPVKFPKGLRPIADRVHSLGMKFGLHLPFAEAMATSRVLRDHPDWAVVPNPNQQRGYFDAKGLCLSHKPAQAWVIAEILRVVKEFNVDWLLQDGENMVKNCLATHHSHAPDDSNYSNSVEGLNVVLREVRRTLPDLMIENCEDGGNMQTFQMTGNYVTSIVNDNSDFLTTRRSVYGATYPFPPRYTDRYMETTPWDNFSTRSHFFGGPLIIMDRISDWSSALRDFAKREFQLYKALRGHIREGKVYHLTPPPDGNFNDALQSYHPATDRSVILVYRQETASDREIVYPRGHRPDRLYRVRFQDSPRSYTAIGKEIAETGIIVELPVQYFAEIVYVEPAESASGG